MSNKELQSICYIAELDQDIDDLLAIEYLHTLVPKQLKSIVLDPPPKTELGKKRLDLIKALFDKARLLGKSDVSIHETIPEGTSNVFIGGALTQVAKYISKGNYISNLVMNGGFVGTNLVPNHLELKKFRGERFVRTFNFNSDIDATEIVLQSSSVEISKIYLIGKNVCHSESNTPVGIIWKDDKVAQTLFKKHHVRDNKKQHDMLACHEGLALLKNNGHTYCHYDYVFPANQGIKGNMTKWGSVTGVKEIPNTQVYRKVYSALYLKPEYFT